MAFFSDFYEIFMFIKLINFIKITIRILLKGNRVHDQVSVRSHYVRLAPGSHTHPSRVSIKDANGPLTQA